MDPNRSKFTLNPQPPAAAARRSAAMTGGRSFGRLPFARRAWQLQAALWALNRLRSSWDRLDETQRGELRRLAAKARSNPRSLTPEERQQLSSLVRAAVRGGR